MSEKITKKIDVKELLPRDKNIVANLGKSRKYKNKLREAKSDVVGRKDKYKENYG